MAKKYFKQIETMFTVMAILTFALILFFQITQLTKWNIYEKMSMETRGYFFGSGSIFDLFGNFYFPRSIAYKILGSFIYDSKVLQYILVFVFNIPLFLFLVAIFIRKNVLDKINYQFKTFAVLVFAFHLFVAILLFVKNQVWYTTSPYESFVKESSGPYLYFIIIVKLFLLVACYTYINELTTQFMNRKQLSETDLSDTVFAELEDRTFILAPTNKWKRFLNYIIDYYFAYEMIAVLFQNSFLSDALESGPRAIWLFVSFALLVYYIFMESMFSLTVGKSITGTIVLTDYSERISFGQALGRSFSRLVPFEAFSTFGVAPWHDAWSNTNVVDIEIKQDVLFTND